MIKDKYIVSEVSITPGTAAFGTATVLGGRQKFTITGAGAAITGGIINSLTVSDEDNEGAGLTIWLFDSEPSNIPSGSAFAPTASDLRKAIGTIGIVTGDYSTINSLKFAHKSDINQVFAADDLYAYVVTQAAPSFAANKVVKFRMGILTQG